MATDIGLVVLVGLPGAGKSTLCKSIITSAERDPSFRAYLFLHVCYDTLIPLSDQEKYAEAKKAGDDDGTESWKGARRKVYQNVDRLVCCLRNGSCSEEVFSSLGLSIDCLKNQSKFVILLDDNFYYQSMRYEFFQLARQHTIGYQIFFIDVGTDLSVERNKSRISNIPDNVIHNMAEKLQSPKPNVFGWESSTVVVTSWDDNILASLLGTMCDSLQSPVQPVENNESKKEAARYICSHNVAHQADIYLRSLVGKTIQNAQKTGCAKSKNFFVRVNGVRQDVMASIQSGMLRFPKELVECVDDNRQCFETILQAEFEKHLSQQELI